MKNAYTGVSTRKTSQQHPIFGQEDRQVQNNAGGFVYALDPFKQLERFLILGSESGTYYVTEQKLTKENAKNAIAAIDADGRKAVDLIVAISDHGRAPKNDPALFALALAASAKSPETRAYALASLPKVARIPTHLFHFVTYVKQFRGLGRGLKRALGNWYNETPAEKLAHEITKYQSRDGWSNADVLRISHPKAAEVDAGNPQRNNIYKYIVDGWQDIWWQGGAVPRIIEGFERAKTAESAKQVASLIREYGLTREMVPTEALNSPEVWEALLEKMPLTAMVRNLGNMSKVGLLVPLSDASKKIVDTLHNQEAIQRARLHPINILIAMKTYAQGRGQLGKGQWTVVPAVRDALDDAFYLAFKSIAPTGKRFLFGVDVSGSMSSPCGGLPITCAEGAAAMALACAKVEQEYYIMGFTSGSRNSWNGYSRSGSLDGFVDLGITPKMSLDEALRQTRQRNFGATDCALPMIWAEKNNAKVDVFVTLTDSETWSGDIHPSQALKSYRQKSGIQAKQVVIGMTSSKFTIADPTDPLTLDVAGFDTSVPQVLQEFAKS